MVITNEDILAGLCTDAEAVSTDIRDCIRLYKENCTTSQLTSIFNQLGKPKLVQTLNFLGAPTPLSGKQWDDYLRPTCVQELIVRIQNLLIDTCGFCNENFACQRTDKCYLKCCNCGQFAHQKCIQKILGGHFDSHMSEADVHDIIFPFKLNCYFFCHECSATKVPLSTTGLKKKVQSKPLSPPAPENQNHTQVEEAQDKVVDNEGNMDNNDGLVGDGEFVETDKQLEARTDEKICHFYRKGNCKHGKSGENCKFSHPPYCKPFLMVGDKHPKGCNKGQSCQFFHPKMCRNSMTKHVCYNLKCKYFHVKNTKRVPPKRSNKLQKGKKEPKKQIAAVKRINAATSSSRTGREPVDAPKSPSSSEHFLGLVQQMKSDLLQTINQQFATLVNSSMWPPNHHYAQPQKQFLPQKQIVGHNVWNLPLQS